ncbi:DUF547 domain-containing protein [Sessilibacter sp. MAH1]
MLNWQKNNLTVVFSAFLLVLSSLILSVNVHAAPTSELIDFWDESDEENTNTIDHSKWQTVLDAYLVSNHPSGINRFNYKAVSKADKSALESYINDLKKTDPREYSLAEQKAYWINLYNALTVNLILDNYPVKSITKLGGFFSFGPWDKEIITIEGETLTLNNIEHGILRPIWKDNRIHYAVNCASMGCPNLSATAFTAENTEALLDQSAKDYVNHTRGVKIEGDKMQVSSIYEWYKVDFGGTDASLIEHLKLYAEPQLQEKLNSFSGKITDSYDWSLNQP